MGKGQFQTDAEYAAAQGKFELDDLKSAKFGSHIPGSGDKGDFRIWHTAGNARLVNRTGDIQFNYATSDTLAESDETFQDQESMLHLEDNAGVKAYYNGDKKFETLSDGSKVTGNFYITGDFEPEKIVMKDDKKIEFGDGTDLIIEHDTASDPDCNLINSTDEILRFSSTHSTNNHPYGFSFDQHIRLPRDKRIEFAECDVAGLQNPSDIGLFIEHDTSADPDINIIDSSDHTLKFKSSNGTYGFDFDNHIRLPDDKRIELGGSQDLTIEHDTANDPDCNIINSSDEFLKFKSSHGTYGFEFDNHIRIPDDKRIEFGNSQDLTIEHDTASDPDCNIIDSTDEYLKFKSTHGTYGFEFNNHVRIPDDKRIEFGDEQNFILEYDGLSDPDCGLIQVTDKPIALRSNHGDYGVEINNHVRLPDDKRIEFGDSQDFILEFDTAGDNIGLIKCTSHRIKLRSDVAVTLEKTNGDNLIIAEANGKSALYYDGSNKIETGSHGVNIDGELRMDDNDKIRLGDSEDFGIYFDGANPRLEGPGTAFRFYGDLHPSSTGSGWDLGTPSAYWDNVYADDFENESDRRVKTNIVDSDLGLSFINKLRPISFKKINKDKTKYGFIAQEVEEVLVSLNKPTEDYGIVKNSGTFTDEDGIEHGYFLNYLQFISPLTKAVQELSAEVETLKAEIAALKSS
jgi:hypothetical protein